MYIFSTLKGFCVIFQHRIFSDVWYFKIFGLRLSDTSYFGRLVLVFQPSCAMFLVLLEHSSM